MRARIYILLLALCLAFASCSAEGGTPYRANDGRTGEFGELGVPDLRQIAWKHRASASIAGSAAVTTDVVLAVDTEGVVVALEPADGAVRWEAQLAAPAFGTPVVAGRRVLVGTDDGLAAVGLDGQLDWTYETGPIEAAPLVVDGVAYVGNRNGAVLAIDVVSGSLIWEAITAGPVVASAVALGRGVVVASSDGGVYNLDPATGEPRWTWSARASVRGLAASGDNLYITAGREVIALDADDPQTSMWRKDLGAVIETPPSLSGGVVIAGTAAGEVVGLDTTDGSPLFRTDVGAAITGDIAVTRELIVVPATRNGLVVVDRAGNEVWTFRTDDRAAGVQPATKRLYLTDAAGSVYALE